MKILYNIGIHFYTILLKIISPINSKAFLWISGRKNWEADLKKKIDPADRNIWIHCASLGEFEQGRPLIEMIKKVKPGYRILLTFFSPSGYEIRKNYDMADHVCYLPADTPGNAENFIRMVNPAMVIFVKYEFWNNYILALARNKVPLYLISGIFRPGQHFFKWYGTFFRKVLSAFNYFFVQDERSEELLRSIGIGNVAVTGDTRFDRVVEIAAEAREIPVLEEFRGGGKLFLAGSSWPGDEEIIARYINNHPGAMKWVFAPHVIDAGNISRLESLFRVKVSRFSRFTPGDAGAEVLIIDNIGMLASAYRYACIAEIGGGFGAGIHNVLEAACWGVPVLFGSRYREFREAVDLVELGGARCFENYGEFSSAVDEWLSGDGSCARAGAAAGKYVKENAGATARIVGKIFP